MRAKDVECLISETLTENREFSDDFCQDCSYIKQEYGCKYCFAEFNPTDPTCARHSKWKEISAAIVDLAETVAAEC